MGRGAGLMGERPSDGGGSQARSPLGVATQGSASALVNACVLYRPVRMNTREVQVAAAICGSAGGEPQAVGVFRGLRVES